MSLIEQLLKLHQVDSQLRGLTSRLTAAERHLAAQVRQGSAITLQIQELQSQRQQAEARAGTLELETAALDERAARLRNEMENSSTHKQHNAILTELNVLKGKKADLESRTIAELELVEKRIAEVAALEVQLAERERIRQNAERELNERRSDVGDRVDELKRERAIAARDLPSETLSLFVRVADLHEGEALAPVEELSRRHREYACSACNVQLPFESVAQLTSSSNAVVQCQSCERILFLHQETRGSLVGR